MGGMFWAIDLDDFNGIFCTQGKYPLINALKRCLTTYTGEKCNIILAGIFPYLLDGISTQ